MNAKSWLGGLSLRQLASRIWREANDDNIFGAAAELAFYLLLALFPLLILLTSLVGFMPGARETITSLLTQNMPRDATHVIRATVKDVVQHRSSGLISFGVMGTLFAASSGVAALMDTLNVAFEIRDRRSFWKVRALALGLTVVLAFLIVDGAALIMFGDRVSAAVAEALSWGPAFGRAWGVVDYLAGLALLLFGVQFTYYFAPDREQPWRWLTPGAVFAVGGFLLGSFGFSEYLEFAPSYSATYGALGAVIVLMLWLYIVSLVVLLGGEIDSEIAKACQEAQTGVPFSGQHALSSKRMLNDEGEPAA